MHTIITGSHAKATQSHYVPPGSHGERRKLRTCRNLPDTTRKMEKEHRARPGLWPHYCIALLHRTVASHRRLWHLELTMVVLCCYLLYAKGKWRHAWRHPDLQRRQPFFVAVLNLITNSTPH